MIQKNGADEILVLMMSSSFMSPSKAPPASLCLDFNGGASKKRHTEAALQISSTTED